jgi:hypothetical protein
MPPTVEDGAFAETRYRSSIRRDAPPERGRSGDQDDGQRQHRFSTREIAHRAERPRRAAEEGREHGAAQRKDHRVAEVSKRERR